MFFSNRHITKILHKKNQTNKILTHHSFLYHFLLLTKLLYSWNKGKGQLPHFRQRNSLESVSLAPSHRYGRESAIFCLVPLSMLFFCFAAKCYVCLAACSPSSLFKWVTYGLGSFFFSLFLNVLRFISFVDPRTFSFSLGIDLTVKSPIRTKVLSLERVLCN